jgi:hypothetical protein
MTCPITNTLLIVLNRTKKMNEFIRFLKCLALISGCVLAVVAFIALLFTIAKAFGFLGFTIFMGFILVLIVSFAAWADGLFN